MLHPIHFIFVCSSISNRIHHLLQLPVLFCVCVFVFCFVWFETWSLTLSPKLEYNQGSLQPWPRALQWSSPLSITSSWDHRRATSHLANFFFLIFCIGGQIFCIGGLSLCCSGRTSSTKPILSINRKRQKEKVLSFSYHHCSLLPSPSFKMNVLMISEMQDWSTRSSAKLTQTGETDPFWPSAAPALAF